MRKLKFHKYQGTGNDFVIVDDRDLSFNDYYSNDDVRRFCDRKFGIGADGLILLQPSSDADFHMQYFNSDGNESSMCGNGGRCIVAFAKRMGLFESSTIFTAIDGLHDAEIQEGWVKLKMQDVHEITSYKDDFVLDTGSPHYVQYRDDINHMDVYEDGKSIRNSSDFIKEGINVNFISFEKNELYVVTYERGVEDETLSCGTGVTAAALVHAQNSELKENQISIKTKGGNLEVHSVKNDQGGYSDIWLCGPATFVFEGII